MSERTEFGLMTAAEVRALAERALAMRDEARFHATGEGLRAREAGLGWDAAAAALVFCLRAIDYLRDPALADLAVAVAEAVLDQEDYIREDSLPGIAPLAATGLVNQRFAALAEHPHPKMRSALASGLRTDLPESAELLFQLCGDTEPGVRRVARDRLERAGALPWWVGTFPADPLQGAAPAEAEAARPILQKIIEHLGKAWVKDEDLVRVLRLGAKLPPRARCETALRVLEASRFTDLKRVTVRASRMAACAPRAGLAGLDRLLRGRPELMKRDVYQAFHAGLGHADRTLALEHWLASLRAHVRDEELSVEHAWAERSQAVAALWPPQADPTPAIEVALARATARAGGEEPYDGCLRGLCQLIETRARLDVLLARVLPELQRGFPGPWEELQFAAQSALERLERKKLAEVVEVALRSPNVQTVSWALKLRMGKLFDRRRDGTRAALALRLDEVPALRTAMRRFHLGCVLPRARRELVAGQVEAREAMEIVHLCGRMFGGVVGIHAFSWDEGEPLPGPIRFPGLNESYAAYLGPKASWLPPSQAEWEELRRLRDRAWPFAAAHECAIALECIPNRRPLHPQDRAFLERAMEDVAHFQDGRLEIQLAWDFIACGDAADVDRISRLVMRIREPEDQRYVEILRLGAAELARHPGPGSRVGPRLQLVKRS
ncbi:MAG: hypothetical protein JST54_24610 [Deltaproteobacteria bacterium]|nr:hypothetical protein [Deltaproteobacteria bacterium]